MSKTYQLLLAALVVSCTSFAKPAATLIPWTASESATMIGHADKTSFFALANNFESQENKFFCGPTSAVIVLNALRGQNTAVKKPTDRQLYRGPETAFLKLINPVFERYTQDAFFNAATDKVKTRDQVFGVQVADKPRDGGIQLRQLGEMLKVYGVQVSIQPVADDSKDDLIKKDLIAGLKSPGHFVIVNFLRKAIGQEGGAHISPLAAYDSATNSVLLMDVNPTDHPWVWVNVDTLIHGMRTKDTIENRGYLIVSEAK